MTCAYPLRSSGPRSLIRGKNQSAGTVTLALQQMVGLRVLNRRKSHWSVLATPGLGHFSGDAKGRVARIVCAGDRPPHDQKVRP